MISNTTPAYSSPRKFATRLTVLLCAALLAIAASACGSDDTGQVTGNDDGADCQADADCDLGEVCTPSNECVVAECDWCEDDQICYVTDDNPEGSCSASSCSDDADCGNNYDCVDGTCTDANTCSSNDECPSGEICSPAGTCVPGSGGGDECETNTDCSPGEECDNGNCVDDGGNGECELEPGMCSGATPYLDEEACQCVECQMTSHCTGEDVCQDGQCIDDGGGGNQTPGECETTCSQDQPGTCGGDTPYCINDCCVECIGNADCSGAEACEDNFCTLPGGCSSDADCPSGYTCEAGNCEPPSGGQSCDPEDPGSCPDGQICTEDGVCEDLGGDMGCGFCNDDCTCPGDLVCDGDFICVGCEPTMDDPFGGGCPDGDFCIDGMCFPFSF